MTAALPVIGEMVECGPYRTKLLKTACVSRWRTATHGWKPGDGAGTAAIAAAQLRGSLCKGCEIGEARAVEMKDEVRTLTLQHKKFPTVPAKEKHVQKMKREAKERRAAIKEGRFDTSNAPRTLEEDIIDSPTPVKAALKVLRETTKDVSKRGEGNGMSSGERKEKPCPKCGQMVRWLKKMKDGSRQCAACWKGKPPKARPAAKPAVETKPTFSFGPKDEPEGVDDVGPSYSASEAKVEKLRKLSPIERWFALRNVLDNRKAIAAKSIADAESELDAHLKAHPEIREVARGLLLELAAKPGRGRREKRRGRS